MSRYAVFCRAILTLGLTVGGLSSTATAMEPAHTPQWSHAEAMAAVNAYDIDAAVKEIGDISTFSDSEYTLERLHGIENRADWPLPAREAVLYRFTRLLADLPRDAIAGEIMQHLVTYQARTLVPHEDHEDAGVPLFNIRGAANGVEHGWRRADAAIEADSLLRRDPDLLVSAYVGAIGHGTRAGYLDTLRYAGYDEVHAVQSTALRQLQTNPGLTPLVGVTAEILGDEMATRRLLMHGKGAGLMAILKRLGDQLPATETASLLRFAVYKAPTENAALGISAWWPRLRHHADTRDLLLATLADPELGSAAALALARQPDIQTIKVLLEIADGDSVAATRAQLALNTSRVQQAGLEQP